MSQCYSVCSSPADAPEEAAAAAAADPEAAAAADESDDTAVTAAEPAAAAAAAQAHFRASQLSDQCVRLINFIRSADRKNSVGPGRHSLSVNPHKSARISDRTSIYLAQAGWADMNTRSLNQAPADAPEDAAAAAAAPPAEAAAADAPDEAAAAAAEPAAAAAAVHKPQLLHENIQDSSHSTASSVTKRNATRTWKILSQDLCGVFKTSLRCL